MTHSELRYYLQKNFDNLRALGLKFSKFEIQQGDKYCHEDGVVYRFNIGEDRFEVGYVYVTEDADDWAQAECHLNDICDKNDKWCRPDEVFELLQNYQQISRNSKLEKLLN